MRTYATFVVISVLIIVTGCDDENTSMNRQGDFYPMKANGIWQYISEWNCDYAECDSDYANWLQYVWEDTVIQEHTYTVIRSAYDVMKIARKDGNKYYEWHIYDGREYLFLDTGLLSGRSWIKNSGEHWKTEVFVERPLHVLTVKGKEYQDVIVMREVTSYKDEMYSYEYVTHRYYARDIGEILSVSPAVPNTYFNGSKLSLHTYEPR